MKLICCFFVLFISIVFTLPAHSNDAFLKDLETFRSIYLDATDGDKRKVRKAIRAAKKFSNKYKKRPLPRLYYGAALSLRGMDIGLRPLDRMRETEQGLNMIDRGLRQLDRYKGDELEITEGKLLVGFLFINLPDSIFHRLKEGNHIIEELLANPKLPEMPEGMRAAIYLAAATSAEKYNKPKEQRHYLELSAKADPGGRSSEEALTLLKELDD